MKVIHFSLSVFLLSQLKCMYELHHRHIVQASWSGMVQLMAKNGLCQFCLFSFRSSHLSWKGRGPNPLVDINTQTTRNLNKRRVLLLLLILLLHLLPLFQPFLVLLFLPLLRLRRLRFPFFLSLFLFKKYHLKIFVFVF